MIMKIRFPSVQRKQLQSRAHFGWIGNGSSRGAKRRGGLLFSVLIKTILIAVFTVGAAFAGRGLFCSPQSELSSQNQQVVPPAKSQEVQAKVEPEKIVPGPQNIKERTAIYVFLGWMWVSIAVLVYVLRLKIKEADRLYFSRYFSPEKK
jgi:hypothetical protein